MINAAELLAAHARLDRGASAPDEGRPADDQPPRQFPLAGQAEVRPLADPSRTGGTA
jgi:hypothetical protein